MADKEISDLIAADTLTGAELVHAVQGGNSRQTTTQDIANLAPGGGGGGGGKIAQVVQTQTGAYATGTTQIPFDDTIPQNTEGDEYMTLAITPTNAASTLLIEVHFNASSSVNARYIHACLFQDSTASALAAALNYEAQATAIAQVSFSHSMTAGTTSATTFKVRGGLNGTGTLEFNGRSGGRHLGGVLASSITITEILP